MLTQVRRNVHKETYFSTAWWPTKESNTEKNSCRPAWRNDARELEFDQSHGMLVIASIHTSAGQNGSRVEVRWIVLNLGLLATLFG